MANIKKDINGGSVKDTSSSKKMNNNNDSGPMRRKDENGPMRRKDVQQETEKGTAKKTEKGAPHSSDWK